MNRHPFLPAVIVMVAWMSCAHGVDPLNNGNMQQFIMWDDPSDGINEKNELQVFTFGEEVMSEGRAPSVRSFGASPCWGDVDEDRLPELVVGDARGFIWIYKPVSNPGVFPPLFTTGVFIRTYFGNCTTIDIGDCDGDGKNDIIAGTADFPCPYSRRTNPTRMKRPMNGKA